MGRVLRADRLALVGGALAVAFLVGTAAVGWEPTHSFLELVMAVLVLLLLLKAASIALVIAIRSVL